MRLLLGIASVLGCVAATAPAHAIDLDRFWAGRCQECHGTASAFAGRHLAVLDGRIVGARKHDLRQFLRTHEAGAAQADAVYEMLLAVARQQAQPQSQTPQAPQSQAFAQARAAEPARSVYQEKCAGCHEGPIDFARASLAMRNGVIVGRSNNQPLPEFLKRHGKLTPSEVPVVVEILARALKEIGGAAQ